MVQTLAKIFEVTSRDHVSPSAIYACGYLSPVDRSVDQNFLHRSATRIFFTRTEFEERTRAAPDDDNDFYRVKRSLRRWINEICEPFDNSDQRQYTDETWHCAMIFQEGLRDGIQGWTGLSDAFPEELTVTADEPPFVRTFATGRAVTTLLHCGSRDGSHSVPIRNFSRAGPVESRTNPISNRRPTLKRKHPDIHVIQAAREDPDPLLRFDELSLDRNAPAWAGIQLAGHAPQLFTHIGHAMAFPACSLHRSVTHVPDTDTGVSIFRLVVIFPEFRA